MLKKRQDKITSDRETAESDKAEALALKKEYEEKLKAADKEAESILSEARKVAMHNEQKIVDEAKQEAARIIERANAEAELEKQRVADESKTTDYFSCCCNGVKVLLQKQWMIRKMML